MKLVQLNSRRPLAILEYAHEHKFKIKEIQHTSEERDYTEALKKCLEEAEQLNCTEYCLHRTREEYDIYGNQIIYLFSIIGFVPIETDSEKPLVD